MNSTNPAAPVAALDPFNPAPLRLSQDFAADSLAPFREVWVVDFEFHAPTGERPQPLCMVCHEWRSGRTRREWLADAPSTLPPFVCGPDTLLVAFYASAELGCYLALDWPLPVRVLDLFVEFRCLTTDSRPAAGTDCSGRWPILDSTVWTPSKRTNFANWRSGADRSRRPNGSRCSTIAKRTCGRRPGSSTRWSDGSTCLVLCCVAGT